MLGIERLSHGCFNFGLVYHGIPLLVRNGFNSKTKRKHEVLELAQISMDFAFETGSLEVVGCWHRFRGLALSEWRLSDGLFHIFVPS